MQIYVRSTKERTIEKTAVVFVVNRKQEEEANEIFNKHHQPGRKMSVLFSKLK